MFPALALCWNKSDVGLTLDMSAFKSLYGGQLTLSNQLIKPNYLKNMLTTDISGYLQLEVPQSQATELIFSPIIIGNNGFLIGFKKPPTG